MNMESKKKDIEFHSGDWLRKYDDLERCLELARRILNKYPPYVPPLRARNYFEISQGDPEKVFGDGVFHHIALRADDCGAALEAARAAGAEVTVETKDVTISTEPPIPRARSKITQHFSKAYNLRNKIVHGSDFNWDEVYKLIPILEHYLRESLIKIAPITNM